MPWFPEFVITYQTATECSAEKVTADVTRSYVGSVPSGLPAFASEGIVVVVPSSVSVTRNGRSSAATQFGPRS